MSNSSIQGNKYEICIYNIMKRCRLNGKLFNTQDEKELGGSKANNDIQCNLLGQRDVPMEIKKKGTPDYMQCSLHYDNVLHRWLGSKKNKIPKASKVIFEALLNNKILFNGKIPPFMERKVTHPEWVQLKGATTDFNDMYFDCPSNTIKDLYKAKGCHYIQISEKGLYHLGDDTCGFKVPEFICEQQIRIRTKIHQTANKKGFCSLSVIMACQPKNTNAIVNSPYSLDNEERLPQNLLL
jgi:hypothetical protein